MEQFSLIFTVFFMMLGPVKLIPSFGGLTRGADTRFKRARGDPGCGDRRSALCVCGTGRGDNPGQVSHLH